VKVEYNNLRSFVCSSIWPTSFRPLRSGISDAIRLRCLTFKNTPGVEPNTGCRTEKD